MRILVTWSPEARADVRAIDRETAMQILRCVDRYLVNREGNVKKLKPPMIGFRLRCGDYRVFSDLKDDTGIEITGVRNRREAYRQCPAEIGHVLRILCKVHWQALDGSSKVVGQFVSGHSGVYRLVAESGFENSLNPLRFCDSLQLRPMVDGCQ